MPVILTLFDTIVINVLCSFIASFIFLFSVLLFYKPKIKISPFMCLRTYNHGGDTLFYTFKVVNRSWYSAYDISIELQQVEKISVADNKVNQRLTSLSVIEGRVSNIAPYRPAWVRKEAQHCLICRSKENIKDILTDDFKTVMVKISLRHGLTGLVRVFTKEYCQLSDIKNGKFSYGTRFGILN